MKAGDFWFRQGVLLKAMATAHYDHRYGPGAFDKLADRTQKRLGYRMLAAVSLLPIPGEAARPEEPTIHAEKNDGE